MTLGATLGAGAMLGFVAWKQREPVWSHPAPVSAERPALEVGAAAAQLRPVATTASRVQVWSKKSLKEILAAGGPAFRLQERVADWSVNATADDLIAALQDIEAWPALKDEHASKVVDRLLNRLAQLDGAEAVEMARVLVPLVQGDEDFVQTAYDSWLAEEPEAAVEAVFKNRALIGDTQQGFLTRMLEQLAESDPRYAEAVAETMAWSGDALLAEVARSRRADVFEAALAGNTSMQFLQDWIGAGHFTPEEVADFRGRLARRVVTVDSDPQRLAQLMDQGLVIDESLRWETIRLLGKVDAVRATNFLLSQTNPENRAEELVNLLEVQAENSPALQMHTTDWLVASYQGADRQALLMEASRKLMDSDLNLAWRAAAAMANDNLKFSSTYSVGFDWLVKDPQKARATLPAEIIERYDLVMELYGSATTGFPPDVKLSLSFSR